MTARESEPAAYRRKAYRARGGGGGRRYTDSALHVEQALPKAEEQHEPHGGGAESQHSGHRVCRGVLAADGGVLPELDKKEQYVQTSADIARAKKAVDPPQGAEADEQAECANQRQQHIEVPEIQRHAGDGEAAGDQAHRAAEWRIAHIGRLYFGRGERVGHLLRGREGLGRFLLCGRIGGRFGRGSLRQIRKDLVGHANSSLALCEQNHKIETTSRQTGSAR